MRYNVIGVLFVIVGIAVAVMGVFGSAEEKQVKEYGEKTIAAVVDKRIEETKEDDGDKSERYLLGLKFFDLKQGEHNAVRSTEKDAYDKTNIGDTVPVKYLPEKPEIVRLESETDGDPMVLTYALGIMGGVIGLLGVYIMWFGAKVGKQGEVKVQVGAST